MSLLLQKHVLYKTCVFDLKQFQVDEQNMAGILTNKPDIDNILLGQLKNQLDVTNK